MKRRFIAGAQCPKCEQQDKIVMYDDEQQQRWRECVACGFKDILVDQEPPDVGEVTTRVNQNKLGDQPLAHETEVQIVQLIDPKKMH
jgi:hypothetical protein